ncbi:radical SAM family heme chaperone HemW [Aquimarina sp. 2-A2]|uniref:radical SAM family heme chaperone HemW n=1 Tax=Aquimarina sp. 2-A2 TaxID=3382644 RepID=UPI00387EEA64
MHSNYDHIAFQKEIKADPSSAGIYIHIPFCKQACHYCDFHFSTSLGKKEIMIAAICREIELRKNELNQQPIATIYFGGGTPSVLSQLEIDQILDTVYKHYTVLDTPEITLEANPDDLSLKTIKTLAASKINRLSIGIQSFFEEDLKLMNRAHNAIEAKTCIEQATQYFDNISIDLIYGIPEMSDARWIKNLETALSFDIPHISSYALTVEPKTALEKFIAKGIVPPINDEAAQRHFEILVAMLNDAGFVHYELSNFGKPAYFSQNNTAYWLGKSYLGIGPSAHSYNGKERSWNISNNPKYIKALQQNEVPKEMEVLTTTDRYNEYVMTGLRTIWGVSISKITNDFGDSYAKHLLLQAQKHIEEDLLQIKGAYLFVTPKGKFLSDGIASDLFLVNLK